MIFEESFVCKVPNHLHIYNRGLLINNDDLSIFTAGVSGADYNPSSTTYLFRQGSSRACIDIQIFGDNVFELEETFVGQYVGVMLPGGSLEPSVTGITVAPSDTEVTISDMDGE